MSEQFKGEKGPTPESLEDQKYEEMQAAENEVDRIMKEMDNILASNLNREEAEKIVFEKWAPLMDEAMKKSTETFKAWLDAANEASDRERKEIDDMEKDLEIK